MARDRIASWWFGWNDLNWPNLDNHDRIKRRAEAMAQANAALGSWRLEDCTLYVTLEPCPMCAGAIINARIPRVYYGARDREMGACGGVLNLFMERFPHRPALVGGILAEECREVLSEFFRGLRK